MRIEKSKKERELTWTKPFLKKGAVNFITQNFTGKDKDLTQTGAQKRS